MARQVNTKFVIALSVALLAVAGGITILVVKRLHNRNPEVLKQQAIEALTKGNLVLAASLYGQTGEQLALRRTGGASGADEMYGKAGDLYLQASEEAANDEEAVQRYNLAVQHWQLAMLDNPSNRDVSDKFLDAAHREAEMRPSPSRWTNLSEQVKGYLKNIKAPSAKPYLYRGQALLALAYGLNLADLPEGKFDEIDNDAAEARKIEPDSGEAVALAAQSIWLRAAAIEARGGADPATGVNKAALEMQSSSLKMLREFLAAHPYDPTNKDNDLEAAATLVYQLSRLGKSREGLARGRQLDAVRFPADRERYLAPVEQLQIDAHDFMGKAIDAARGAFDADPADSKRLTLLVTVLRDENPQECEKILKDYLARNPDTGEALFNLGQICEKQSRPLEAIEAYKKVINIPKSKVRGGLEALQKDQIEKASLYFLASLSMDQAENKGLDGAGKADMDAATFYTDRLRKARVQKYLLDMLDGRAQLMRGNIPQAVTLLHSAETSLGNSPSNESNTVKLLLASANEKQRQYGEAIRYLDEVLKITLPPSNIFILLNRVHLQIELGKYDEALTALNQLEKVDSAGMSEALRNRAQALASDAHFRRGDARDPALRMELIKSVPILLQLAYQDLIAGDVGAVNDDLEKKKLRASLALETLKIVLEKEPRNPQGLLVKALAHMQLEQKVEASKAVEALLADHPDDRPAQMLKLQLEKPDASLIDLQKQVIEATADEYLKQFMLAQWYGQNRQPEKALECLQAAEAAIDDKSQDAITKRNDLADRLFSQACTMALNGKDEAEQNKYWNLAQTYVQRAERLNLDGVNGIFYRGRMEWARSKGESGAQLLEKAAGDRLDYAPAHVILGSVYYKQGVDFVNQQRSDLAKSRFDAALEQFKMALRLMPNNLEALRYSIAILNQNRDRESHREAIEKLNLALRLAPRDPALLSFSDMLGDPAKVIVGREAMLKSDPGNADNIRQLALLYSRVKEPKKAVDTMKILYDKQQDNLDTSDAMARFYAENQQMAEATKVYTPFIESSDAKVKYRALLLMGDMLESSKDEQGAIKAFQDAMVVQPEGADEANRHLADLYFDRLETEKAIKEYQTVLEKSKPGEPRNRVVLRLAECEIRKSQFIEATSLLNKEILEKQPDNPKAMVLRAYAELEQGREATKSEERLKLWKAAMDDINQVLAKSPDNDDALYYRALVIVKTQSDSNAQGEVRQAIEDLLRVRERDRSALRARMLLADAYRMRRQYAEAASEYADILTLRPDAIEVRSRYAQFLLELVDLQMKMEPTRQDDLAVAVRAVRADERLTRLFIDSEKDYPVDAHLMRGNMLANQGKMLDAQAEFKQLHEYIRAQYKQMLANPPITATPEQLEEHKQELAASLNTDIGVSVSYMQALLATKNYEEVVSLATELLKDADTLDLRFNRAAAYALSGKSNEALADLDIAFAQAAKKPGSFLILVTRVVDNGVLPADVVIGRLQARYTADPKDMQCGAVLAYVLARAGHIPDAMKVVQTLKAPEETGSSDDHAIREDVLRVSGSTRLAAGDKEGALKDYLSMLTTSPEDTETLNNAAYLLIESIQAPVTRKVPASQEAKRADEERRVRQSLALTERAIKIATGSTNAKKSLIGVAGIYDTYGWALYLAGERTWDESLVYLKKSKDQDKQPSTFYHLAKVCQAKGLMAEARNFTTDGIQRVTTPKDPTLADLQALEKELK